MDIIIRRSAIQDAEAIAALRRQDGIREKVLALSSDRVNVTEKFLRSRTERDRAFTAEYNGTVAGFAALTSSREPMRTHAASMFVMVDKNFAGHGIASTLLSRLIDSADNELHLHRLELLVLTDNTPAIKLYQKFGFKIEATKKNAAVVGGRFVDEFLMGRIAEEHA